MKTVCPYCNAIGFSSTKCKKCSKLIPEPKVKEEVVVEEIEVEECSCNDEECSCGVEDLFNE